MNHDFINSDMIFVADTENKSYNNDANCKFILAGDNSLLHTKHGGDFSLYLGNDWRFEIMVDSATGLCVKPQIFLDQLPVTFKLLHFPEGMRCGVRFSKREVLIAGDGCHYIPFDTTAYWDKNQEILCIGSPEPCGCAVEFINHAAMCLKGRKLCSLYLSLKGLHADRCFAG